MKRTECYPTKGVLIRLINRLSSLMKTVLLKRNFCEPEWFAMGSIPFINKALNNHVVDRDQDIGKS